MNNILEILCLTCTLKDIKCDGNYQKLCDIKECKSCYNRSFATSEKAKYWVKYNKS